MPDSQHSQVCACVMLEVGFCSVVDVDGCEVEVLLVAENAARLWACVCIFVTLDTLEMGKRGSTLFGELVARMSSERIL